MTCGGAGCGIRAREAGLTADDCCVGRIMDSDVFCDDSGTAPCIIEGERFGLVLLMSTGWNTARGTLYFITLLLTTRFDRFYRSGRWAVAVRLSSEKLDLWLLLNSRVSRQNSAYFFIFSARKSPASTGVSPSSVTTNNCFVDVMPENIFRLYVRMITLANSLTNGPGDP